MFGLKKKEPKYELVEDESTRVYLDKAKEEQFWTYLENASTGAHGRYIFNRFLLGAFPDFASSLDTKENAKIVWNEAEAGLTLPYFVKLYYARKELIDALKAGE